MIGGGHAEEVPPRLLPLPEPVPSERRRRSDGRHGGRCAKRRGEIGSRRPWPSRCSEGSVPRTPGFSVTRPLRGGPRKGRRHGL